MFHRATAIYYLDRWNYSLVVWKEHTTLCVEKKKGTAHHHQNLIPTVNYGGRSVMVWGCFAASGPGQLAIIDGKMNSQVYQDILQENVRLSVFQLKLNRSWVMQQNNDPKQNRRTEENMPSGVAQSESWPQPDWDAMAWPQQCSSHQTSQEYCWTETVL